MFHIAICDDEEYFRIREKKLIEEYMENHGYAFGLTYMHLERNCWNYITGAGLFFLRSYKSFQNIPKRRQP